MKTLTLFALLLSVNLFSQVKKTPEKFADMMWTCVNCPADSNMTMVVGKDTLLLTNRAALWEDQFLSHLLFNYAWLAFNTDSKAGLQIGAMLTRPDSVTVAYPGNFKWKFDAKDSSLIKITRGTDRKIFYYRIETIPRKRIMLVQVKKPE